jgi:hypothetical protein
MFGLNDEIYYEAVAAEIQRKELKPGLWTKAVAESAGSNDRARSIYIKLRANQLRQADVKLRAQRLQRKARDVLKGFFRTAPLYATSFLLGLAALGLWRGALSLYRSHNDPTVGVMISIALAIVAGWGSIECFKKARRLSSRHIQPDQADPLVYLHRARLRWEMQRHGSRTRLRILSLFART